MANDYGPNNWPPPQGQLGHLPPPVGLLPHQLTVAALSAPRLTNLALTLLDNPSLQSLQLQSTLTVLEVSPWNIRACDITVVSTLTSLQVSLQTTPSPPPPMGGI